MGGMTNKESAERYYLVIGTGTVTIVDSIDDAMIKILTGPDRLLAATAELNRLNAAEEPEPFGPLYHLKPESVTPAVFLAETLPAVARRQRLESQLAEVTAIEADAVEKVRVWAEHLRLATELRERIEKTIARPLSATLPDENTPVVGVDTSAEQSAYGLDLARAVRMNKPLYKPGPCCSSDAS